MADERAARQLLDKIRRLPENKCCVNCGKESTFGHTDACVKFNSFVCSTCKNAHQSFSHRCKSVNLSNWTLAEVQQLLEVRGGGNSICRRTWLGKLEKLLLRPDDDLNRVKDFVNEAYNYKRYWQDSTAEADSVVQKSCIVTTHAGEVVEAPSVQAQHHPIDPVQAIDFLSPHTEQAPQSQLGSLSPEFTDFMGADTQKSYTSTPWEIIDQVPVVHQVGSAMWRSPLSARASEAFHGAPESCQRPAGIGQYPTAAFPFLNGAKIAPIMPTPVQPVMMPTSGNDPFAALQAAQAQDFRYPSCHPGPARPLMAGPRPAEVTHQYSPMGFVLEQQCRQSALPPPPKGGHLSYTDSRPLPYPVRPHAPGPARFPVSGHLNTATPAQDDPFCGIEWSLKI